jgi:hypothetical protein
MNSKLCLNKDCFIEFLLLKRPVGVDKLWMHGESKLLCIQSSSSNKEKYGNNWLDVGNNDS